MELYWGTNFDPVPTKTNEKSGNNPISCSTSKSLRQFAIGQGRPCAPLLDGKR